MRPAPPTVGQIGGDEPPELPAPGAPSDELAGLLASFVGAAGYKVQLDRKDARGRPEYLETMDLTPDLLEDVRGRWGGGQYRARVVDERSKYQASVQFSIAGVPRVHDAAPTRDANAERLERLEGVISRVLERLEGQPAAVQVAPPPAPDMLGMFATFAKLMKDLTPAPVAPVAAVAAAVDPFALVGKVLELQTMLEERGGGGRASDGDSLSAVVSKALPPLLDTIKQKMQQDGELMRLRMTRRPVAVVPAPDAAPVVPDGLVLSPLAVLVKDLPRYAAEYLANMAALDKDPALYAATVLDRMPPDVTERLPELLAGENAGAELASLVPAWAAFPEWFGELAREILTQYAEQQSDDDAGDGGDETERKEA